MSKFFRGLAFLVAVCCLTWVGVLWWWQRAGHSAEVSDLVLYLGLLPLALAALLLGGRWLWRRAAQTSAPAAGAAADGSGAASVQSDNHDEQERHAVTPLVLASAFSVTGDQPADLLEAAAEGKPLPQPDAQLSNQDGLPVLCVRIADKQLDMDAVEAACKSAMAVTREQVEGGRHADEPGEHVLRALAALSRVLEPHRDWLATLHQRRMDSADPAWQRLPPSQRPAPPVLQVLLGCPSHWSGFEQALLQAWTRLCLAGEDPGLEGAYDLALTVETGGGETLWLKADRIVHGHGQIRPDWLLVAACDSDLSAERVDALATAQDLYDATHRPGGAMPGEGAAAVLLARPGWVPPDDMDLEPVLLHRPALLQRDKPVHAAGRVSHRELAEATSQALLAAQVEPDQVGMLVGDADLHSHRGAELFGLAVDHLAHLDPAEDMRLLGRVTGRTGAASSLLLLAASAAAARSLKKPVLALSSGDARMRMALVLKPSLEAAPDAA